MGFKFVLSPSLLRSWKVEFTWYDLCESIIKILQKSDFYQRMKARSGNTTSSALLSLKNRNLQTQEKVLPSLEDTWLNSHEKFHWILIKVDLSKEVKLKLEIEPSYKCARN